MSEMLQLQQYKPRFTLFRSTHFTQPVVYPLARLQLPRQSILHFVAVDGVTVGPQASDQIFLNTSGLVYVENKVRLEDPVGNPMKTFSNADLMQTEYRRRNRSFRPLRRLDRLENDNRSIVVYNYAMIAHLTKYAMSFRASWYMWRNVYAEVFKNVNRLAEESVRHQFIEVNLPAVMPGLGALREYRDRQDQNTLAKIRTPEAKLLADIFIWAGEKRQNSLLGQIDPKYYDKINFIVRRLNGWVVINLGWLNKMRSEKIEFDEKDPNLTPEQLKELKEAQKEAAKGMDPVMFSLRVLKLLTLIHQATTPIATTTAEAIVAEPEPVTADTILDDSIGDFNINIDEEDEVITDELLNDDDELAALEKELEELDKLKYDVGNEEVDDDGEIVETTTLNIDALSSRGEPPKEGEAVIAKADEMASKGLLTPGEHRRLLRLAEVYKTLPNPYGGEGTFEEAMKIDDADTLIEPDVLTNDEVVLDKSLTFSRVDAMERQYISKVLKKDIMRCVSSMQRGGVAITGYHVDRYTDAVNDRETHIVKFAPAVGTPSTVRIPIPVIKEDGTYLYNGTTYRMRKQRSDLPIRKVSADRVALSSYYAKLLVERSERKKFSYYNWILDKLELKCQDGGDPDITHAVLSNATDHKADVPLMYATLAERISSFTVDKMNFFFDYRRRIEKMKFDEAELKFEKNGWVLCGRSKEGALVMDPKGLIYRIVADEKGGDLDYIGTIEQLCNLDIDPATAPTMMAEMKIYSKVLPVGFSLGYLLGLEGLLKKLKVKPRRVLVGEKLNLGATEFAVRFKDESLIFDRSDVRVNMLMSGFNRYADEIRTYEIGLFEDKDVFAAVLDREGTGSRYLRELDSMNIFFVDPITEDLLKWMKEPTVFTDLLLRAVEMLSTKMVTSRRKDKDQRVEGMERVRGYERVAGIIYETLSKAMRSYNARISTGKSSIQVNPNDPTNLIIKDPTNSPVNNINPVHSLREREVITFGGRGGRSRRSMVASTRLFTDEDMGFISEGTVDSGDVAIITYLSPNSNITTVRGTVRLYDEKRDGASSIMSTAALLSFASDGDDPKRVNFTNVQHGHGISVVGGEVQAARTGMERAMVSRMNPMFASVARANGVVTEVDEDHIVITYDDGDVQRLPLGLIHTDAEGSTYPHSLKTMLKAGDKVGKFDVLTYNPGFFKPSAFDANRVDYINGVVGRVALREATYTVEDSSSLAVAFASRMTSTVSKTKPIMVDFREGIHDLVKIGDKVDLDTILCTIEGATTADSGMYDESTRETLRNWSAMSPRAKAVGTVADIKVYYNGDIDDMSDSLQEIVSVVEKKNRRRARRLGEEYTTGVVPRTVRIEGYTLEPGQAIILVYITTVVPMGIGDKLVFANQMKSTVGEILFGNNRTLEGEPIDAIFGAKSCIDRIVTSPFVIGSLNTLLRYLGEIAYEMYFGEEDK